MTSVTVRSRRTWLASCMAAAMCMATSAGALHASETAIAAGAATAAQTVNEAVGEVSLVLGRAWLESTAKSTGNSRIQISAGTPVRASDRIVTESNGHVHIRFVDEALVSVRPDSRLEIVQYDYNAEQPQQSAIKLHLEEGVTRSISGRGASAARERFRLNTPIAAIGVRGTDFVVNASPDAVRALVNEGAIVLAPFSSECTAAAFGPCANNAVELTDNSLQMIELDGSSTMPRLLASAAEREPSMEQQVQLAAADIDVSAAADDKTASTGAYLENVTAHVVTGAASAGLIPRPRPSVDYTPSTAMTTASAASNNLAWGRFGPAQGELERLTLAYSDVRLGREVTVGWSDYTLFREKGPSSHIQQGLGDVSFTLDSAQAFYHSASGVATMAVSGGKLDINFDRQVFSTELQMSHTLTGKVNLVSSGSTDIQGFFRSQTGDLVLGAGAVNGKEAGYFFEKQLQDGNIQGITLWDRP